MNLGEIALLVAGGLLAGVVNTLAGGGSLLTVPLLVLVGVPGNVANGSNRVGVLLQNVMAAWSFRRQGVSAFRSALPVISSLVLGSVLGALAISRLSHSRFETAFGIVMLLFLVPTFIRRSPATPKSGTQRAWSPSLSFAIFLAIGIYGGAFQAGVGILLLLALSHAGFDLVRANAIKVIVITGVTAVALPVFILKDQVAWLPALLLAAGYSCGGVLGARLTIHGGERLIRPVVIAVVILLAARMLKLS